MIQIPWKQSHMKFFYQVGQPLLKATIPWICKLIATTQVLDLLWICWHKRYVILAAKVQDGFGKVTTGRLVKLMLWEASIIRLKEVPAIFARTMRNKSQTACQKHPKTPISTAQVTSIKCLILKISEKGLLCKFLVWNVPDWTELSSISSQNKDNFEFKHQPSKRQMIWFSIPFPGQ